MALVSCRECGNKISTEALSCPSCGCPVISIGEVATPEEKIEQTRFSESSKFLVRTISAVFGLILLIAVIFVAIPWYTNEYQPAVEAEQEFLAARQKISALLVDPTSAQFRNEKVMATGGICGEVNSKNRLGGYVGYRRYWVSVSSGEIELEGNGLSVMLAVCN